MKKIFLYSFLILFLLICLLTQFGIQIGNIRIGKQIDLKTKQNLNFEESNFYKNNFSNNNLTVLNLWATWCVPCIEEMPELNSVQKKYLSEKINFISLSVDNDSIKLIKFINKGKFKFQDITLSNLKYRTAILNNLEGRKPDKWISSHSVPVTYLLKNNKVLQKFDGAIGQNELISAIENYK